MTSSKASNIPLQEYRFCESEISESVRNNRSDEKCLPPNNTHVTNCSVTYGNAIMSVSAAGSVASTTSNAAHCNVSNGNANCIDVISVPIDTVQYHRRKFTLQEYQSRVYHNTAATDYRCREDIFSDSSINTLSVRGGTGVTGRSSTQVPSLQLQGQLHQHYSNKVHHHQQSQNREQIAQQASTSHYNLPSTCASAAQDLQHNQKHSYACSPTLTTDLADDTLSCSLAVDICQMVAATQPHQNYNYEPAETQASLSMSSLQSQVPPLMYTVHRVVATSQIQTTGTNTFTSSSSVSSIVSAVRNETESMRNALTPVSATLSRLSFVGGGDISSCLGNSFPDETINSTSIVASQAILHNTPPGFSSNVNYITSQTNEAKSVEASQTESVTLGPSTHTSSGSFTNCVKTTSSISRPLQNVIPACVYLISRVAVHMEIEGTAQCPSQVMLAAALGCEELGIANKLLAQSIFGLWMTSSLLEIQLKSYHRPYVVRVAWPKLLDKFSHGNLIEKKYDEPMITLKRSIFFSKHDEEKIKDHRILELLYEEAKHNVLTGRYIMESVHSLMLGGIQARIELGPFNSHTHTVRFLRENQSRFLPQHVAKNSSWSWLPVSRKNSAEVRLLEQFKRVPQTATTRKLMRKYLEFCWALPFYGAAFFHGQVEQPVHGLMSLVNQKDIEILVAVNERGLFIIDSAEYTLLLGLCYEDFSWDFAKPSTMNDPECLTCIFLQFDAIENGIQISKLMQIFSKQAPMIDALISHFAGKMKKRKLEENNLDQFHDEPNPIQNNGNGVLCNKLARLTLATFDEDGRCIGQMGSLSISY